MPTDETLGFYAREAEAYATRAREADMERLRRFAGAIPPGGRVLELGCGGGHDSEELIRLGLDLLPTDGSPELVAQTARRLGRPAQVLLFEDLADENLYAGIWANACLLHVPRAALPGILARIHRALRPGGLFQSSYKAGEREGHDRFGRFFNYPSADWLRGVHRDADWASVAIEEDLSSGYDGEPTRWLHVTAVKRA
jgi:SAM-dependent methyltransferase